MDDAQALLTQVFDAFAVQPDGRIAVDIEIDQTVPWSDSRVRHYHTPRDGRVARMDIEPLASRT
jgi:hypothetical protein